jgi:hypothetical protein
MPHLLLVVVLAAAALFIPSAVAADPDCYELQTLTAKAGKLDALHAWLREHRDDVLAKHGAECVAFLVPVGENPDREVLFIYRLPSLLEWLEFRQRLKADPAWKQASEGPDALVERVEAVRLAPTYYSPAFTPSKTAQPRVFELRAYTCPSPESLAHLHARFRDHTMGLFAKHGMENLIYWNPRDIDDADRKLIYLLGHKSVDAAKESFGAFRKDPDWLAAKEASEKEAGGSLTEKAGGVLSEFLVATEYSPLR